MKKNIAIKVRIYPNKTQINKLNKNFGCVRYIHNQLLSIYEKTGKIVSYKEVYNDDNKWLKESDTSSYSNEQLNLNKAIHNHYINPNHFRKPVYKSKHNNKQSYTTSVTNNNSRVIDNKHLKIPKVGILRAVIHRDILDNYVLKSVTISKDIDGSYYASLLYEYNEILEENQTSKLLTRMIGIDYSMNHFGVLSNGIVLDYPKFLLKNLDKLKEAQRKLSKCKIDSNNYKKRKQDLARLHVKIKNQRKDWLNKCIYSFVKNYDTVVIEDLDLKEMSSKNHFGKKISDNSFGTFIIKLKSKLEQASKKLIKVNKYYPSSKRCSKCGNILDILELSQRTYSCSCGNVMDRDYNAAINIVLEAFRIENELSI